MRYLWQSREDKHTYHVDTYGVFDNFNKPVMVPGDGGKLSPMLVAKTVPKRLGKTAKKNRKSSK